MHEYHCLKFEIIYNILKIYTYIITSIQSSLIAARMIILIQDMT